MFVIEDIGTAYGEFQVNVKYTRIKNINLQTSSKKTT